MADIPPSALPDICVTSVILVITRLSVLILDWTISYLCWMNSTDVTSSPPLMSTSTASVRSPVSEMTLIPRLAAVTDFPVMSDIFWLKVVICSVKVCLNVTKDCLMKVSDLSCPGAGLNSRL